MAEKTIFKKFLESTENDIVKRKMRDTVAEFENGYNFMYFICLKATVVDAVTDVDFSSVTCKVEEMEMKDTEHIAPIGCFFSTGCKILKEFLTDVPQIPSDEYQQRSLQCLLEFLSSGNFSLYHLYLYM